MNDKAFWETKLAARIHDPAEKALVLLRDPAGHENGTSRVLKRLLALDQPEAVIDPDNDEALSSVMFKRGLPISLYRHVQRADWWAAAADRPQWPMERIRVQTKSGDTRTLAVAHWAQVRWTQQSVLIHPLTGDQFELPGGLGDTEVADVKARSFFHHSHLLEQLGMGGGEVSDIRKVLLAFWRFGPELPSAKVDTNDFGKLGALWPLLPADTRVPDHSIWDHLDLTSAFAGAFAADADGEAALLAISIGPVQSFIASARTTSDLWAGSHLLARLAWEAMRPLCEKLGPDAILFPRLRGIPQVDLWLRDGMNLPPNLFDDCEWMRGATDANPLFSAALPNRFVAIVPASQVQAIAESVTRGVREWLQSLGERVVDRLWEAAGLDCDGSDVPRTQMRSQLEGFPEVHWATVPFSLIRPRDVERQTDLDVSGLSETMKGFFDETQVNTDAKSGYGFLDTAAWKILQREIEWSDGTTFFTPNPGVLYPAVHELLERVLAAAKSAHTFNQTGQEGWRCSLTGESEWLTHDRSHLLIPPGQRRSRRDRRGFDEGEHVETLWTRVADNKPSWAKRGEHLGALPAIKRLWPTLFAEEVGAAQAAGGEGEASEIGRFVVSTHTMALAYQLDRWLERGGLTDGSLDLGQVRSVALPRRLVRRHARNTRALNDAKRIPAFLEEARDSDDEGAIEDARRQVQRTLGSALGKDDAKLETYYALIMMDGDRMGAILSGEDSNRISFLESFHPAVQEGFSRQAAGQPLIRAYGDQKRPVSPNRHLSISGALNDFSQTVVRHVVEEEHLGRVIYAGGDDVLAMLPVSDLLSTMQRLRHAYSGTLPEDADLDWGKLGAHGTLACKSGFAWLNGRLMRMMGRKATASCGAVIAHHQAPLGAVLRELRAAEKRAKQEGGRDAFSLSVIKRSGGDLRVTGKWGEPIKLFSDTVRFLSDPDTSRRAVYSSLEWIKDLPDPRGQPDLLATLLAFQFVRQSSRHSATQASKLSQRLAALTAAQTQDGLAWLENYLSVAEFLARETRAGVPTS